jgi:hypothetical protein
MDDHQPNKWEDSERSRLRLSRRKMLASVGMAGAALASGAFMTDVFAKPAQTVTENVYGTGQPWLAHWAKLGAVNVLDYGAKGDGVTDDTAAFAAAASEGKPILVPKTAAWYVLQTMINLTNSIIGIGMPDIRMQQPDGSDNKRMFSIVGYRGGGLHIAGVRLDGQYTGGELGEQSHLLRIIDSRHVHVHHNVLVDPYGDCVYLGSHNGVSFLAPCEQIYIYDNEMSGPRRCVVAVVSARSVWIRNNVMNHPHNYVACIDIEPNKTSTGKELVEDVWIEGNTFYSTGHFVNSLTPNVGLPNKRITVHNNQGRSRYLFRCNSNYEGNTVEVRITNNLFYGSVGEARMLSISKILKGLVIRGNQDYATGAQGWVIQNAVAPVIADNCIEASRAVAMALWNCKQVKLHGNQIKDVYSSYGAVQFLGNPSSGHHISSNSLVHTDYGFVFKEVVTDTLFDGNVIDAKRFAIKMEPESQPSDIKITGTNLFTGEGVPVGGADTLSRLYTPEAISKGAGVIWADAIPVSGTWSQSSIVMNRLAQSSSTLGWVCVQGGTPGQWQPFGIVGEERLVLKAPGGSRYSIQIDDTGTLMTQPL